MVEKKYFICCLQCLFCVCEIELNPMLILRNIWIKQILNWKIHPRDGFDPRTPRTRKRGIENEDRDRSATTFKSKSTKLKLKIVFAVNLPTCNFLKKRTFSFFFFFFFFVKGWPQSELYFFKWTEHTIQFYNNKFLPPPGIEPRSLGTVSRWLIHYATVPH